MTDIRDHSRALHARLHFRKLLIGRRDIFEGAAQLISAQDGKTDAMLTRIGNIAGLPGAASLAAVLREGTEYEAAVWDKRRTDIDRARFRLETGRSLQVPAGCRLEFLHFSPILQAELMASADGKVMNKKVTPLPQTRKQILRWLGDTSGMRIQCRRGQVNDKSVARAFRKRHRFSLIELADWLYAVRGDDPVLYVLLLSNEFLLALHHRPTLVEKEARKGRHFEKFAGPQILPLLIVAEFQRTLALLRYLHKSGVSTGTMRVHEIIREKDHAVRRSKISDEISKATGVGKAFDEAPVHADALARLFKLADRPLSDLDPKLIYRALSENRVDWDHAEAAAVEAGALELIATMLAPRIMRRAPEKVGHRNYDDPLDLYYGIDAYTVAYVATIEIGFAIGSTKSRDDVTILAARLLDAARGFSPLNAKSCVNRHKEASRIIPAYLEDYDRPGSAGRFAPTLWVQPELDLPLVLQLIEPVEVEGLDIRKSKRRWLHAVAMHLLRNHFAGLYNDVVRLPSALNIVCHCATSATTYTSDPMYFSILRVVTRRGSQTRGQAARKTHTSTVIQGQRRAPNARILSALSPIKAEQVLRAAIIH